MKKILVYGTGVFYKKYEKQIKELYQIVGYIDRKGFYEGNTVPKSINDCDKNYDNILVMTADIAVCFEISNQLLKDNIPCDKILLGFSLWGQYSQYDSVSVTKNGKYLLEKNGIKIQVGTKDEFYNVTEVLLMLCYQYQLSNNDKEIVFDIGMNVGDATLYFLSRPNVEKVYAFEPFRKTYADAMENLKDYTGSPRLSTFSYGLSDCTEERSVTYNSDMTCGQSTIESINKSAMQNYIDMVWGGG